MSENKKILKGLFGWAVDFEEDATTPAPKVNLQQASGNGGAAAPINYPPAQVGLTSSPSAAPVGVVDDGFAQHFNGVLDESKIPGNAYSKFNVQLNALEALKTAGVAESVRYQTALATLKTSTPGVSKKSILDSAAKYVDLLNKDDIEAGKLVEQRKNEEIGKRQQDIVDLQNANQAKIEQIAQLNKDIQDNNTKIGVTQGEIITKGNEIEQRNQNFKATWNVYYTRIQTDIANITSFLPEDAPAAPKQ